MNQHEMLLQRLKQGPITPLEALNELGIFRLGARVFDLKNRGHTITSQMVEVTGRGGKPKHVALYTLIDMPASNDEYPANEGQQ